MDTGLEDIQRELIELLILVQRLSPTQLRSLCQFAQSNSSQDTLFLARLLPLLQSSSPEQLSRFIALATKQIDEDNYALARRDFEAICQQIALPLKEAESSFGLLVGLYQLQDLLKSLSILQLMKLFEIIMIPVGDVTVNTSESHNYHMQQLQLLQQIQQIFTELNPQVLQRFHQQLSEAQPGTEQQVLMQLINLPAGYFQLYQPLRLLLQLDSDELLLLKEVFAQISPAQMVQLLQLLQQQPFDVLELRNILNLDDGGMNLDTMDETESQEPSFAQEVIPIPPPEIPKPPEKTISLQIVEQTPEKSVYKRNLRPNPVVMLVGDQKLNDGNLYVVPILLRCDNFSEESKYLTGNRPVRVTSGRVITFKKLKITTTSHQQQETLFCIRFELRRYSGEDVFEVLDQINSNPICVLSHSTQMKPVPTVAPIITDVIPECGPVTGGTRVAILGSNFVDSPTARIRFDNTDVMPVFHGPGTLICHTPQHMQGSVTVRVSNAGKKWSDTGSTFTFVDMDTYTAHTGFHTITARSNAPGNISEASWRGDMNQIRKIQESGGGNDHASNPDNRGFTPLQYAAANGFSEIVSFLLENGSYSSIDYRDTHWGNTALHWAVINRHFGIVQSLIEQGANFHAPNFRGDTPLFSAVIGEFMECVDLLLESGAEVNAPNIDGNYPLHAAVATGNRDLTQMLLRFGAHLNLTDDEGENALFIAIRESRSEIAKILLHAGIEINAFNDDGELPVFLACSFGEVEIFQMLISRGADLTQSDFMSETIYAGRSDLMEILIKSGVDVNEITREGITPAELAHRNKFTSLNKQCGEVLGIPRMPYAPAV